MQRRRLIAVVLGLLIATSGTPPARADILGVTDAGLLAVAKEIYDSIIGGAKGGAQATGQAAQLQAEATMTSAQMLARNNAETLHDTADYTAAAIHSSNAYDGRIGYTQEAIEVARSYCYEGLVNRTSGPERIYVFADKSSGTAASIIGDVSATVAAEHRRPAGTTEHAAALEALPESIRTGRHYVDGTALPMTDLDHLSQAVWMVSPQAPANTDKATMMADQMRYGLARQIIASWYADLMPISADTLEGRDLAERYPLEVLPTAPGPLDESGNSTAAVPGYAVLRAAAVSPWIGASPEDPQNINATYAGYLLGLSDSERLNEVIRLLVINNRLLYEQVEWQRYETLLAAERDLRTRS